MVNEKTQIITPEMFQNEINVSRETLEKLKIYADLLIKWQQKINLVSSKTLPVLWHRHIYDSAQLFSIIENKDSPILDIGSGAGFPSLVLAIMGQKNIHLVESDTRKCAFMREVIRKTGVNVTIHNERIESLEPFDVKYIIARALATIEKIFNFTEPFISNETIFLLQKGENFKEEILNVKKRWTMRIETIKSLSNEDSVILKLQEVQKCPI